MVTVVDAIQTALFHPVGRLFKIRQILLHVPLPRARHVLEFFLLLRPLDECFRGALAYVAAFFHQTTLGPPQVLRVVWLPLFGSEPARYACTTRFCILS